MSTLPTILPPDAIPAGLERASVCWHHFEAAELDPALAPYTRRNVLAAPTQLRAGSAWAGATDGRCYRTPEDLPRFEWWDLDSDGILETPHLVIEDAESNLVPQSDALGSWASSGTITATAGHAVGELDTWLLSDTDGTNAAYRSQPLSAFTGSAVKGLWVVWGRGTSPAASGAFVRVRDTTAGVDRLNATITPNADGSPNVAIVSSAGVALLSRFLRVEGGVAYYALFLALNAVTAANAHEVRLGAAVTGSQQGNVYFGGVTITDEPRVASWIDRPSAGAVTRARESVGWLAPHVPTTAHVQLLDFLEVGAVQVSGAVVAALTDSAGANPSVRVEASATGRYQVTHHNGTSSVSSVATAAPSVGDRVRVVAWLYDDGSVQIGQGLNGGLTVLGPRSAALALPTAWGANAATRGFYLQPQTTMSKAKTRLRRWKVAPGTLTELQLDNRW